MILLALLVAGGGFGLFYRQARRDNPTVAFQNALQASLSTTQLQTQTTTGTNTAQVSYDFSSLTDPIISSQATVQLDGASFQVMGYGSSKNTYVSYNKLPSVISGSLASAVQNGWIQLRAKGTEPPGVSAALSDVADPRYQAFGPIIFGNFPIKTQAQYNNFLQVHNIYAYNPKQVTKTSLNGSKVFVYPVKLNVGYLQVFAQSVASNEGFSSSDIQAANNALSNLKGAKITLYVSVSSHRLQQISITQGTTRTTTVYSNYNNVTLPNEPQTQLSWQDFAPTQLEIEEQAAAHQSNAERDADRKADLAQLHTALADYFIQNALYPTLADLDNQSWVASNLAGLDPDAFRDPGATSLTLASTPQAGMFAYQPLPASGTGICDNTAIKPCVHYKLTATLSTGQLYTVQDP